jgi:hypothetical protein
MSKLQGAEKVMYNAIHRTAGIHAYLVNNIGIESEQTPSLLLYLEPTSQSTPHDNSESIVRHGYEAERYLSRHEKRCNLQKICFVRNTKLVLGTDSQCRSKEDPELKIALDELKCRSLIQHDEDVIVEFLAYVFKCTKDFLSTSYGLNDQSKSKYL